MSEYIVNESRFIIDISDELKDEALPSGLVLPNLSTVGDQLDRSDCFQIYDTADGAFNLLVVKKSLAELWIEGGFVKESAFWMYTREDGTELAVMFSPSSLILTRVSAARAYGSLRYALSFGAALIHSRSLNHDVNLRDGIFCELYSVILPCWTKARAVADRALFANVLSKDHREDISSKEELGVNAGVSRMVIREELNKAGIKFPYKDPYLEVGELIDDFVYNGAGLIASNYLVLDDNYQIYATGSDSFLLLMEPAWANELILRGFLSQLDFGTLSFGGIFLKALCFSNHFALEKVNDRHFGLTQDKAFRFALAVKRSRSLCPNAVLTDALYCEELGLLLPTSFEGGSEEQDAALVEEVVTVGPFAISPFLEDVIAGCVKVVA